jgi:hypothetical protein
MRAWIYLIGFSVIQLLITLTLAFDTKMKYLKIIFYYTPSLKLPPLHSTGYEPKASGARSFDTQFVLPFKQVIRPDDAIVRPHLQSKLQESFEDCGCNCLSTHPQGPR